MAATAGSLFKKEEIRIQEILNKNLEIFLPTLDPIWRDSIASNQGVYPTNGLGRDMVIKKRYNGAFTGVIENAAPSGDFVLYGDQTTPISEKLFTQSLTQTFPDPLDGPNAQSYGLTVPMRAMVANLAVTLGEMQMDATEAVIGEVIAPKLEGWARNMAHTLCNYWYLSQNEFYALAAVAAPPTSVAANANFAVGAGTYAAIYYMAFSPANYAVDRFVVGQRVDIYDVTGATRRNIKTGARVSVWVSRVDEMTNTVQLATNVDPSTWTVSYATTTIGDYIVYANSKGSSFTGIAGYNSWFKFGDSSGTTNTNTNTLLGSSESEGSNADGKINVNIHPEFKSFLKGSVGVLTEQKLRTYLRGFSRAKARYGQTIDTLIASDGVWLAYEAQKIGREIIDRTGRLSSLQNQGSEEGMKFTFEGRSYEGYTSTYMPSGELIGIKKNNGNWKRITPADPAGVQSMPNVNSFVPFKFVGSALSGTGSNRLPIYSAAGTGNRTLLTEAAQMPGMIRMQLVPDQPAGLKLTGVTEERVYSD